MMTSSPVPPNIQLPCWSAVQEIQTKRGGRQKDVLSVSVRRTGRLLVSSKHKLKSKPKTKSKSKYGSHVIIIGSSWLSILWLMVLNFVGKTSNFVVIAMPSLNLKLDWIMSFISWASTS